MKETFCSGCGVYHEPDFCTYGMTEDEYLDELRNDPDAYAAMIEAALS